MSDAGTVPNPDITDEQHKVLAIAARINSTQFDGWFLMSSVMAVCQIESAFRQFAFRYEPALSDASYSYMQVLSTTAQGMGYTGPCYPRMPDLTMDPVSLQAAIPGTLYDPEVIITLGMKYLREGWDHLANAFGRKPTLAEWFAGYNEGYGAAARGRPDPAYVAVALHAFNHWLDVLDERARFDAADLTE